MLPPSRPSPHRSPPGTSSSPVQQDSSHPQDTRLTPIASHARSSSTQHDRQASHQPQRPNMTRPGLSADRARTPSTVYPWQQSTQQALSSQSILQSHQVTQPFHRSRPQSVQSMLGTSISQQGQGPRLTGFFPGRTRTPAQIMMDEMQNRQPWGVRLMDALSSTNGSIRSLDETCAGISTTQVSVRDRLFEVQNTLKTLPGKDDIMEELNEHLPGMLETSVQPILDKLDTSLHTLPSGIVRLVEGKLLSEMDRVLEVMAEKREADQRVVDRQSPVEEPMIKLMNHLISSLDPLNKLASLIPMVNSLSDLAPTLKALPQAVLDISSVKQTIAESSRQIDQTKEKMVEHNILPTPQRPLKQATQIPSTKSRFSALAATNSPEGHAYALRADDDMLSPNIPPLSLDDDAFVAPDVLFSPQIAGLGAPRGQTADRAPENSKIVAELGKLESAVLKLEARLERSQVETRERVDVQMKPEAVPDWAVNLSRQMEEIRKALANTSISTAPKSHQTPTNPAQVSTAYLPTPVSATQAVPVTTAMYQQPESFSGNEAGDLIDMSDGTPQDVFGPVKTIEQAAQPIPGAGSGTNDLPVAPPDTSEPPVKKKGGRPRKRPAAVNDGTANPKKLKTGSNDLSGRVSNATLPKGLGYNTRSRSGSQEVAQGNATQTEDLPAAPTTLAEALSKAPLLKEPSRTSTAKSQAEASSIEEGLAISSQSDSAGPSTFTDTYVDPPAARTRGAKGIRKERIAIKKKVPKPKPGSQDIGTNATPKKNPEDETGMTTSSQSSDDSRASDFEATRKKNEQLAKRKNSRLGRSNSGSKKINRTSTASQGRKNGAQVVEQTTKAPSGPFTFKIASQQNTTYSQDNERELTKAAHSSITLESDSLPLTPETGLKLYHPQRVRTTSSLLFNESNQLRFGSLGFNSLETQNSAGGQPLEFRKDPFETQAESQRLTNQANQGISIGSVLQSQSTNIPGSRRAVGFMPSQPAFSGYRNTTGFGGIVGRWGNSTTYAKKRVGDYEDKGQGSYSFDSD